MAFLFNVWDLYEYAFSTDEKLLPAVVLTKDELLRFQVVLVNEISSHSKESSHYKYVVINYDREKPVWEDHNLFDFGDCYLSDGNFDGLAERMERRYHDEVITSALRKARLSIRTLRSIPADPTLSAEERILESIEGLNDIWTFLKEKAEAEFSTKR